MPAYMTKILPSCHFGPSMSQQGVCSCALNSLAVLIIQPSPAAPSREHRHTAKKKPRQRYFCAYNLFWAHSCHQRPRASGAHLQAWPMYEVAVTSWMCRAARRRLLRKSVILLCLSHANSGATAHRQSRKNLLIFAPSLKAGHAAQHRR